MDTIYGSENVEGYNTAFFEQFELFKNPDYSLVFYTLIGYCSYSDGFMVEATVVALGICDAWIPITVKCLCWSDTSDGNRRKQSSDPYAHMLLLATSELIGNIRLFVTFWATDELKISQFHVDLEYMKDVIFQMARATTTVVNSTTR